MGKVLSTVAFFILLINTFSVATTYNIDNGNDFIATLEDLTNIASDPNRLLQSDVTINLSGTITLNRVASFSAYENPSTLKCEDAVNITIQSQDPNNPAVVEASGNHALLYIYNCGNFNITIKNVIFRKGVGETLGSGDGAIILVGDKGNITVENCQFIDNVLNLNSASDGGVYIKSYDGKVFIKKNYFYGNSGTYNGALMVKAPEMILHNNLFARNKAGINGGTVNLIVIVSGQKTGSIYFSNNTVYGNFGEFKYVNNTWTVSKGVGLNISFNNTSQNSASAYIYNNIIYNNGVNTDASFLNYKGLQVYIDNSPNQNIKNIVYFRGNAIGIDSGLFPNYGRDLSIDLSSGQSEQFWIVDNSQGSYEQFKNMVNTNPRLINPLSLDERTPVDYSQGNYRLKPNSPVIDKGYVDQTGPDPFPADDIDGEVRPKDGDGDGVAEYDIGFDEVDPANIPKVTINVSVSSKGRVIYPSDASLIDCSDTSNKCSTQVNKYSEITLKAVPSQGYEIDAWGQDCSGCAGDSCKITMDTDKNCSVSFLKKVQTTIILKISPRPSGGTVKASGGQDINCGSGGDKCLKQYNAGDTVTLEAVPDKGFKFVGWDGDCNLVCNNNQNPCKFSLPKGQAEFICTALFKKQENSNPSNNDTSNSTGSNRRSKNCSLFTINEILAVLSVAMLLRRRLKYLP